MSILTRHGLRLFISPAGPAWTAIVLSEQAHSASESGFASLAEGFRWCIAKVAEFDAFVVA